MATLQKLVPVGLKCKWCSKESRDSDATCIYRTNKHYWPSCELCWQADHGPKVIEDTVANRIWTTRTYGVEQLLSITNGAPELVTNQPHEAQSDEVNDLRTRLADVEARLLRIEKLIVPADVMARLLPLDPKQDFCA